MSGDGDPHTGGCLCGAVRYEVHGPLRGIVDCHCTMCRRLHGAFGAHSKARKAHVKIVEDRGLKWYATSARVRRGFCGECGTNLFCEPAHQAATGIVAGSLDQPTRLVRIGQVFTAEKADFVDLAEGVPTFAGSSEGALDNDHV